MTTRTSGIAPAGGRGLGSCRRGVEVARESLSSFGIGDAALTTERSPERRRPPGSRPPRDNSTRRGSQDTRRKKPKNQAKPKATNRAVKRSCAEPTSHRAGRLMERK